MERTMAYVNVGVKTHNLDNISTKKALKDSVSTDPENVYVYGTSAFFGFTNRCVTELDKSDKYQVVGPDPYTSRKWYATIEYSAKLDKWVVK
jgi:hypothetical protein